MQQLQREDWFFKYEWDDGSRITRLFFTRISSQNSEVLLMDCTYKIHRYKMSLMIMNGVIGMKTAFYVGFAFLSSEHTSDFE